MSRRWRLVLAFTGIVVVATAAVVRLFVWPARPAVGRVDAVVMLSGDHGERLPLALELVREDPRRVLVLAGQPDTVEAERLCSGGEQFEVVCLRPTPDSTRSEGRATGDMAEDRGWERIAVVTSTYHAVRAGMLFRRCFDGEVVTVSGRPPYGVGMAARQVLRELAASLYLATIDRSC